MEQRVNIETLRLSIQMQLDSQKTALERNKLGQFATPPILAREMVSYGLSLMPQEQRVRFLDPAVGTGSFYSALLETIGNSSLELATGYEVDPHYGEPARELWSDSSLDIKLADFTQLQPPHEGFNFLICNPPYVRHHHLNSDIKRYLKIESEIASGVKLSGLAGLYCYFMALSHRWMSVDGIAGWLIPSEFMDVNYGQELKKYLLEKVTLLRIHRFDPNNVQFNDALVSSAVVWFKKSLPPIDHTIEFSYGGTHSVPIFSKKIPSRELANESKWTRFPRQETRVLVDSPILSDLFSIKRGIATGSNDFFILSRERIDELGLSMEFFRPILPSPRYVENDEIEADDDGNPILSKAFFLLDCHLEEEEIKKKHPRLWYYLESGKERIASRHLCRTRTLWYKQESRNPTPLVCTYMGRSRSGSARPFRFLLNHSKAIAANSYLMLYPKSQIAEQLIVRPDAVRSIWEQLNNISPESLISEGRIYGGGLHKIEPKELAKVPVKNIAALLNM